MNFGRQGGEERRMNLTPLIDVVFLLLIFFMVTTTFEKQARLKLELPEATPKSQATEDDRIVITITEDGKLFVNSNELIGSDRKTIGNALLQAAKERRDMPIIIRADANAAHRYVVRVLDELTRLGFRKTAIATVPEADSS